MPSYTCPNCSRPFTVSGNDQVFYDKISVPHPTLCPDCRQQRRLAFRNERHLYKRWCDLCGKETVSLYHADTKLKIYCPECWWSDKWDALEFGRTINLNQPFFSQYNDLKNNVPHIALRITNNENSDYVNLSGYNKNCYLLFAAEYNEDCLYGTQVIKCNSCLDTLNCTESEYCYEVIDIDKCYNVLFSQNCKNCSDSMFLFDCKSCSNCLFCTNLREKKYHILNKPVSKEEFARKKEEIVAQLKQGHLNPLQQVFADLKAKCLHRNLETINAENSLGDHLLDVKNCHQCFDLSHALDCRFVYTGFSVKDLTDVCHTTEGELGYEAISFGYKSYNVQFANGAWTTNNSQYIDDVHYSSDVFGCVGLKKNKYCILNKQYSKEEYETLVPRIIEHMQKDGGWPAMNRSKTTSSWGEFFPINLSPFAYNETTAAEYFPLSKEEALAKGYAWKDPDPKEYLLQTYNPPSHIKDIPNIITTEILACNKCGKNYKITQQELNFYRQIGLYIPHKCPDCRHADRFNTRNPRSLRSVQCSKCHADILTTYQSQVNSTIPEIIYCENCYLENIY